MASSALHLPSLSTHLDYYQSVLSVTVLMVTLSATMALTVSLCAVTAHDSMLNLENRFPDMVS